jgi:hypothetical protein
MFVGMVGFPAISPNGRKYEMGGNLAKSLMRVVNLNHLRSMLREQQPACFIFVVSLRVLFDY